MKLKIVAGKIFVFAVKGVLFVTALLTIGLYIRAIGESSVFLQFAENLLAVGVVIAGMEASRCMVDIIREPATNRASLILYTLVFALALVILVQLGRADYSFDEIRSGLIKSAVVASVGYGLVSQIDPHRKPAKTYTIPFNFYW